VYIKTPLLGNPGFVIDGTSKIPLIAADVEYSRRIDFIEEVLNQRIAVDKAPMLRFYLLRHHGDCSTILLNMSHTIVDGYSGMLILGEILQILTNPDSGIACRTERQPVPLEMDHYFPEWTKGFTGLLEYIKINSRLVSRIKASGVQTVPRYERVAPLEERRMQFITRELNPDLTEKIIARARAEKTSANGAIAAAHFIALSEEFERIEGLAASDRAMVIMSNVDLRKRATGEHLNEVVDFASVANVFVSTENSSGFWDIARSYHNDLSKTVAAGEPFLHLHGQKIMRFLTGWAGYDTFFSRLINRLYSKARQNMTLISNVGAIDFGPKEGRYKPVSNGILALSRMSGMIYSITSTLNGSLTWTVTGVHPLHSRERLQRLLDRMIELVELNCRG
jgi:NRPS condensation-like uncharacterized protein